MRILSGYRAKTIFAVALGVCVAGCADDPSQGEGDLSGRENGAASTANGTVQPKTVSGVELPELGADMRRAARMTGDLPCSLPVIPDNSNGRVLDASRSDAQYDTGVSSGEAAAFYQAAAEAKGYSITTRGGDGDFMQEIDTHQLRKCTTLIEYSRDNSGGATVVVRFVGG